MRTYMQKQQATRGFSLTELVVVLFVAGVIFAGVWVVAANMNSSVKHQKFSELLTTVAENVRGAYTGRENFESTNATTMMPLFTSKNVFPGDTVRNAGGISVVDSPFGRQDTTGLAAAGTVYNSVYVCGWRAEPSAAILDQRRCNFTVATSALNVPLFAIEALLPTRHCMVASMKNSSPSTQSGLVAVYINGNRMGLPVTLTAANGACTAAVNYVDFVYRLIP